MFKNHADRKWILLILLALVLETTWFCVDQQWIHLPMFLRRDIRGSSAEAGYVIKSKDDLKKRGANSLIWEEAKAPDVLYFHDSVLTLSQSTAKLYLKDQTELQLSENTLVTLEEPDDKSKAEIRLRFSKGDMRARNPNAPTKILGEDWVVNLSKGSEVSLRKDKDSYEFEVVSGQATLQTKEGTQELSNSKIMKLNSDQKIEKLEKTQALQWSNKAPIRHYIFEDQAEISLKWSGGAQSILLAQVGQPEKVQILKGGQQTLNLPLKLGSYQIRLQGAEGLSESKTVEIWRAPRIFLKKPLPRDRLRAGVEQEFVWTIEPGVKDYQLKFESGDGFNVSETSAENFLSKKFEDEKDMSWRVEGRDEEGYVIPSFYENPIFVREQPLQAPVLRTPFLLRAPAKEKDKPKPGALLWKLWIQSAWAAEPNYEVVFEWEPVEGADQYVLEVSSNPNFRKPELIQKIKTSKFVWQKSKYKKYYWRVAAGTSKGRMGFFSEPMELRMQDIHELPKVVGEAKLNANLADTPLEGEAEMSVTTRPAPKVLQIKKDKSKKSADVVKATKPKIPVELPKPVEAAKPIELEKPVEITNPVEVVKPTEITKPIEVVKISEPPHPVEVSVPAQMEVSKTAEVEKPAPSSQSESADIPTPSGFEFAWTPTYKISNLKGEQNSKIQLAGGAPTSFYLGYTTPVVDRKYYSLNIWNSSQTWKGNPKSQYPFQPDLSIPETWISVDQGSSYHKHRWGFSAHQTFVPTRASEEIIDFKSLWLCGARYSQFNGDDPMLNWTFGVSFATTGSVHELGLDWKIKKYMTPKEESTRYFYGFGGNALYQSTTEGGGSQGNLLLLLGLDKF